jgi:hypothetical protein
MCSPYHKKNYLDLKRSTLRKKFDFKKTFQLNRRSVDWSSSGLFLGWRRFVTRQSRIVFRRQEIAPSKFPGLGKPRIRGILDLGQGQNSEFFDGPPRQKLVAVHAVVVDVDDDDDVVVVVSGGGSVVVVVVVADDDDFDIVVLVLLNVIVLVILNAVVIFLKCCCCC